MIWSKQYYHYNVLDWLRGDPAQPPPPSERKHGRNEDWKHLNNAEIISMPDKWEYPWYASWDLAFHTIALALVDAEFAKRQLVLLPASGTCIRMASYPPTNGRSAMSTRPFTAGRRVACSKLIAGSAARKIPPIPATWRFLSAFFTSCC